MTLSRQVVVAGVADELDRFGALIGGLSPGQWTTSTRCAGWKVADVAAHVVGTVADIAAGRLAELAAPGAPERQVAERAGLGPSDLAKELEATREPLVATGESFDDAAWSGPPPVDVPGTLGMAVEGIWYDAYVHADDIRDALGLPSERGAGLRAAVSHLADLLTQKGWGPATLKLDGLEPFAVNGGGPVVAGDALEFVLVATGRAHPMEMGLTDEVNVYRP